MHFVQSRHLCTRHNWHHLCTAWPRFYSLTEIANTCCLIITFIVCNSLTSDYRLFYPTNHNFINKLVNSFCLVSVWFSNVCSSTSFHFEMKLNSTPKIMCKPVYSCSNWHHLCTLITYMYMKIFGTQFSQSDPYAPSDIMICLIQSPFRFFIAITLIIISSKILHIL